MDSFISNINYDKLDKYDNIIKANSFNAARLNYFLLNGVMNIHDEIPESVVHGGVEYFIAMKEKNIELDTTLTYEQKEQAKLDCEKYYRDYELMLKSLLEKRK